jgi:hypothetical protein
MSRCSMAAPISAELVLEPLSGFMFRLREPRPDLALTHADSGVAAGLTMERHSMLATDFLSVVDVRSGASTSTVGPHARRLRHRAPWCSQW